MAKKNFEPMYTRWINLAKSIRNAKGDLDFGEIDPKLTADEQREDNEIAMMVDEVILDMRALATEMNGYFGIYVDEEIKQGITKALGDEETFQKMVALLIEQGALDPGTAAAALSASTAKVDTQTDKDDKSKVKDEKVVSESEDKSKTDSTANATSSYY